MSNSLNAKKMLGEAEKATGLSDWGNEFFRAPFELLINDLNAHANLNPRGVKRTYHRLIDALTSRLKLIADRKRFPDIAKEEVKAPIFVAGLPRAGTTFFHGILAADPANRSPKLWEIMFPSPPPEEATFDRDPRIKQADEALEYEGFKTPAMLAIHPYDVRRSEECNFMWQLSLQSVNFMSWWNVPNYTRMLTKIDMLAIYQEEKQLLQHLQYRFHRDRWVLKTPAHNPYLSELFAVFPDARIVLCHRDPAKTIPSLSNNFAVNFSLFSDVIPAGEFGILDMQAEGMRNVAKFRAQPEYRSRFFDAHFLDVQADPVAVLKKCYAAFDISLTPEREAAVRAWLRDDRESHAKGPRHSYQMETFGLDFDKIDKAFGDYYKEFGVTLER